ncbi:hypothetical protein LTR49_025474 [Elasticomyces elasticus]|nr:hypothetical protein LTR49_025474 [Elasticomyces elasticus]KAK5742123.1 hypothetical protein LTS12_024367 [Elasticomyces elasticus]
MVGSEHQGHVETGPFAIASGEAFKTSLVEFVEQPSGFRPPIDKDARVTYTGNSLSNLNLLKRASGMNDGSSHHASNRVSRQSVSYEPDRLPVEALQLPDKQTVDRLLEAYFAHISPGFPVVDEVRFMAQYEARDPSNPPSLLLLQAMLMAGAHILAESSERQALKATFFRRAKMLIDSRFERNRDTVVQAALLLATHTDGIEDVCANDWYWVHYASTVALGLGMHRDAEPSTLVPHNKRMWRRVFWLLFCNDVALALHFGRPQSIHLQDCDVRPISQDDFEECGTGTQVDFVMLNIELAIVVSEAIRRQFRPNVDNESRKQALQEADAQLARWSQDLPDHLRLRPTITLDMYASLLHLDYNTVLILMHRLQPRTRAEQADMTKEDGDICSAAASHVQSLLEGLRERQSLVSAPGSIVHVCFTALIHLSTELHVGNPVLSSAARRRYDSVLETLRQICSIWPQGNPVYYYFEHKRSISRQSRDVNDHPEQMPTDDSMQGPGIVRTSEPLGQREQDSHGDATNDLDWQGTLDSLQPEGSDSSRLFGDWAEWQERYWHGTDLEALSTGEDLTMGNI